MAEGGLDIMHSAVQPTKWGWVRTAWWVVCTSYLMVAPLGHLLGVGARAVGGRQERAATPSVCIEEAWGMLLLLAPLPVLRTASCNFLVLHKQAE